METTNQNEEQKPTVVIPKISRDEADRIIRGFNEQFEEKVLGKLQPSRRAEIMSTKLPENISDYAVPASAEAGEGRSLDDYLSAIKAEPPDKPFSDPDSQIDLYAKHRAKN